MKDWLYVGLILAATGSVNLYATDTQPAAPAATARAIPINQMNADQLVARAHELRELMDRIEASMPFQTDALEKRLADAVTQYDAAALERWEKKSRWDTVINKIRELTEAAQLNANRDPVVQQLQKIAELRDKHADSFGPNNPNEAAITAAAEAHIKLEERREAVAASVGGGILPDLNRELVLLSIDVETLEMRLHRLADRRSEMAYLLKMDREYTAVINRLTGQFHRGVDE